MVYLKPFVFIFFNLLSGFLLVFIIKAFLFIPMDLEHASKTYWMQLDAGSDGTMFYGVPFSQLD